MASDGLPALDVEATRMRVKHGRVMHRVEPFGSGTLLRSLCRKPWVRGGAPAARAIAPAGDWSAERYEYPDCGHCPPDPS